MFSSDPLHFSLPWFVVQTKPMAERKALAHITQQGFEAWLPLLRVERRLRGRLGWREEPLFRSYLFVQFDPGQARWVSLRHTPGVARLLGSAAAPMAVPTEVIEVLRGGPGVEKPRVFQAGDEVLFSQGPFKGLQGTFLRLDGRQRAQVLIQTLSQVAKVRVDLADIDPGH